MTCVNDTHHVSLCIVFLSIPFTEGCDNPHTDSTVHSEYLHLYSNAYIFIFVLKFTFIFTFIFTSMSVQVHVSQLEGKQNTISASHRSTINDFRKKVEAPVLTASNLAEVSTTVRDKEKEHESVKRSFLCHAV